MSNKSLSFDIEDILDNVLPIIEDASPSRNNDKANSESQANSDQNSNGNESVPLPKESKIWFFVSYSSFLIFYLVFVLALVFTYPLKPICEVENFEPLANITEQMSSPGSLWLNFNNRNPLISYSYGNISLNVTVSYYPPSSDDALENGFSTTTTQGFYQPCRNDTRVEVRLPVTGPRGNLLQMFNESRTVYVFVKLNFYVSFNCSVSCRHKKPLHMTPSVWYPYENKNRSLIVSAL